jgi:hypothetical protein
LTEDQGDLGLAIKLNNLGLLHFVVQIVTLTSTLSDTSEDRVTTVSLGNVVDQLLNEHSLSDTSSSEKTNLSTTSVWGEQVDDLDTSNQDLGGCRLFGESWGFGVNGKLLGVLDGPTLVDWITSDVHDTTESSWTDWHHDRHSGISRFVASDETFGTYFHLESMPAIVHNEPQFLTIHSNASNDTLSQMLLLSLSVYV